jgi:hypothetical protein
MAFIQPCFIRKNSTELRKKLEELGYEPCHLMTLYPDLYKNIAACNFFGSKYYGMTDNEVSRPGDITDAIKNRGMIDCGINEDLFFALAALRDDTDKNQWIIDEANECFGVDDSWMICDKHDMNDGVVYTHYRKATVEEIIKRFKNIKKI